VPQKTKHQEQKTYNMQQMLYNWKQGRRTQTHKDRLVNIIMPKITPLQNYQGLQEAYMTSVSGTLSNENLLHNFTVAEQNISIFFL
jgi:hypothetical protein